MSKTTPCPHCGSEKEAFFSRIEPMGFFCPDCGKDVDISPEEARYREKLERVEHERNGWKTAHDVFQKLLSDTIKQRDDARGQLVAERALADRLAETLQRIANEDYRGNRPHHCEVAYCGVKAWKEARGE